MTEEIISKRVKFPYPKTPRYHTPFMDLLTPSSSDLSHASTPPDDSGTQEYEELGVELLRSMKSYGEYSKKEYAPLPSLSPSTVADGLGSQKREAARARVVELAQQILDMTMDPRINLLINSLSVR